MNEIRILHFVSSLSKSSGVMSVIMNYYRYIDRNKVQFDFIYFKDADNTYEKEIKCYGGKTYFISKPSLKPSFKAELIKIINGKDYTALHNHLVFLTFYLAPIAKKNGIKNIITHSHATMYSDKPISSFRNRLLCLRLKRHATHYFACSNAAGEFLYGKKSMEAGDVLVVNNAIDCEKFKFNKMVRNKVRNELGLEDNFVIGHIGRFNEQKNHMFLIEIFAALLKKDKQAKLVLVGEGLLYERVKERIKQKKIGDNVVLLGKRDDVHELLQGMDAFLLPSLFEGLPVVGVETQASGLPIVMSKNITQEIGLINYEYISLGQEAELWADKILRMPRNVERSKAYKILMDSGFEISIEAKKLEKIYLSMQS